jgi:hypothetical protein
VAFVSVIVNEMGSELRCRKVPDEAFVARTVHVPVAIGVIAPLSFMEHFAGVVVLKENAPSPEPPLAVAVALWFIRILVADKEIWTAVGCGAKTPK